MDRKQKQDNNYSKQMEKHVRKQKLRDSQRKTGVKFQDKKPRRKKITPAHWTAGETIPDFDFETFEPIMQPGEKERRRQREKQASSSSALRNQFLETLEDQTNHARSSVDSIPGLIIESGSSICRVALGEEILLCNIRGNVKDADTGFVNTVAVGDQVLVHKNGSNQGVIEAVLPRRNFLARPYSPDVGKVIEDLQQIIVANVDLLLIVASWREPYFWPALIDRYLIAAQRNHILPYICINKIDLVDDQGELDEMVQIYSDLGYNLLLTCATTGQGIEELRNLLQEKTSVLAGLSGVGKSTLLMAVQPGLDLKIGFVSESGLYTGQGRHTTTQSTLWKLESGGVVIDTPGIRTFSIAGIPPDQLDLWYPEIDAVAQKCRFSNCTHINETDCGVVDALQTGEVSQLRYKNYTQIFEEITTRKD